MSAAGQFCSVARALDLLGGRWTLLVVRELLLGGRRFNEIRRGIPRVSRTVLSERLQALVAAGVVTHQGESYGLTEAGRELLATVAALGTWGQRWLPREAGREDLDLGPLLLDMQRRVRLAALPAEPLVVRFELARQPRYRLLLKAGEAALCAEDAGFPERLLVGGPLAALAGWWRGDHDFAAARRAGLTLEGPRALARAFPDWFERYLFHAVAPAKGLAA